MSTRVGSGMPSALRAFPHSVVELGPDGVVLDSNGRLERTLERQIVGQPLARILDEASRRKLDELLRAEVSSEIPRVWELMAEGRDTLIPLAFYVSAEDLGPGAAGRTWLVECPRDPRFDRLHEELVGMHSEQATTERQLAKEKGRLTTALGDLERQFEHNERLARELQAQNEEVEAQNQELLAMTEELHSGREDLLRLNYQLERRTRELQIALGARTRFYASMSHELRTPINAVMGYNDLLLAGIYGALTEQQELAVERSQRAARHLRELVSDVLDISRLEAGKLEVEPEEVRVADLVDDLFTTMKPVADGRGTQLHLVTRDSPRAIVTDPRRVRQVLLNLLSNAIKFGKGRPVWLNCGRAPDGGAEFEVVDTGDGIAPEDLNRIFDEFVQLARDENGEGAPHDGTGLGLPIARRLTRLLGGRLDVSSTPGVGSTFRLTLPPTPPAAAVG